MNVKEKLLMNVDGLSKHGPVNIVIFGDSVSHGAFNGYIDYEAVYWNRLRKKLNNFRTYVPVNMICAAIGGTTAQLSLGRLDSQVLCHRPDLVIVCFGLNDVNGPLEDYISALQQIFQKCLQAGCDVIFMTPNMLNTYVAGVALEKHREYAEITARIQNEGRMDQYMQAATELAESMGVTVCDCYAKWKKLAETQDTTQLLANGVNHPIPEMHELFAESLYEIIIGKEASNKETCSTMFQSASSKPIE